MKTKREYTVLYNDNKRLHLLNVFSVKALENDLFEVREECDQWYYKKLTKDEMLLMIEELKNWVEKQPVIQK